MKVFQNLALIITFPMAIMTLIASLFEKECSSSHIIRVLGFYATMRAHRSLPLKKLYRELDGKPFLMQLAKRPFFFMRTYLSEFFQVMKIYGGIILLCARTLLICLALAKLSVKLYEYLEQCAQTQGPVLKFIGGSLASVIKFLDKDFWTTILWPLCCSAALYYQGHAKLICYLFTFGLASYEPIFSSCLKKIEQYAYFLDLYFGFQAPDSDSFRYTAPSSSPAVSGSPVYDPNRGAMNRFVESIVDIELRDQSLDDNRAGSSQPRLPSSRCSIS